jgi:hypothetical protein
MTPSRSQEDEVRTVERIGVQMHGVNLTLEVDHAPLADYARQHLDGLVQPPAPNPDLLVRCSWSRGAWDPEANPFHPAGALNVVGKRMLGNADELIWLDTSRKKGLKLRFQLEPGRLVFDVHYRFDPKSDKQAVPEYEYKGYFSLLSYLVYYPLFWYLEQFRGWTAMHASALAWQQRGVVIAGVGGVGKTTTCVALMELGGMELISENLILTDGERIYQCLEPIRLDDMSLAILGDNLGALRPIAFPDGLKDKGMYHLDVHALDANVRAAVLLLPTFSARRYVKPLPPALAAERIVAMNRLTKELDDYGWYAAAANLVWTKPRRTADAATALHRLTRGARCFELGIDRSAGIEAVVEDIVATLGDAADVGTCRGL